MSEVLTDSQRGIMMNCNFRLVDIGTGGSPVCRRLEAISMDYRKEPARMLRRAVCASSDSNAYVGRPRRTSNEPDIAGENHVSQRTLRVLLLAAISVMSAAAQTGSGHVEGVVKVPLKDGSVVRTTMNTNLPWWANQYEAALWASNLSASLFNTFSIREAMKLRFNADFFEVLNNPGLPTPGGNGILSTQNSSNSPRNLQLTLRLTW